MTDKTQAQCVFNIHLLNFGNILNTLSDDALFQ